MRLTTKDTWCEDHEYKMFIALFTAALWPIVVTMVLYKKIRGK